MPEITPVEIVLSTQYRPPVPPPATKIVVESVELRITVRLVAANGSVVSPSYTWSEDVTSDEDLRGRALEDARKAMPDRFPA